MKKSERTRLSRLLKKCVEECIKISYLKKVVSLLDVDFTSPPENAPLGIGTTYGQPEFTDVIDKLMQTESYEKLSTMVRRFLPSLFKTRVDDIISTILYRAILPKIIPGTLPIYSAPYVWNGNHFRRAFQELMYQFQQPETRCRYIAPIFDFDIKETVRVDRHMVIRKATPFDRHLISRYKYVDAFVSSEYDCVLEIECDFDIKQVSDTKFQYANFIELSRLATSLASCLRIFSGSRSHLRFGVYVNQDKRFTSTFPGLIESPELVFRSTSKQYTLPDRDSKELSLFWENYNKLVEHGYFQRAINRYNKAIVDWEDTGKFIDFILSLENLFKGSLAEKQYKAATLVSYSNKDRVLVYDFLDIVIKQRGGVIHGQKEFGDEFIRKINNFYGQKRDLDWYISDLQAIVRQCLRLFVIIYDSSVKDWDSYIIDTLLKHKTNRTLVGNIRRWTLRGLPSFL